MSTHLATFDDWVAAFRSWQEDIGLDRRHLERFTFDTKYGDLASDEIAFGDFTGARRWESVRQIPDQRMRDAVLNYIVYQGDTEFASVEQQHHLYDIAPSTYDFQCLTRVMAEEMRHGYQMCHLLVTHFGHAGRLEADKLLQRRAYHHQRLLGSFNEDITTWLDFFTFTQFVDRDGKYQLRMLSHSAFAPLARSMGPMLKEESFHLGVGYDGLRRVIQAGRVPIALMQKFFNKWVPTAYDLFGSDHSGSAHWGYVWGLKGRYDEETCAAPADRERLNETARELYMVEIRALTARLNRLIPAEQPRLYLPDMTFHRRIGAYAGEPYSVTGERLQPEAYAAYLTDVLPQPADLACLAALTQTPDWLTPKQAMA